MKLSDFHNSFKEAMPDGTLRKMPPFKRLSKKERDKAKSMIVRIECTTVKI